MKKLIASACLVLLPLAAGAADLSAAIAKQLAQPPVLRGTFEQTKQVAGFAKPLRSRGSFLVSRDKGVLWDTREPFASKLRLTRGEIVATQNGAVSFQLSAAKEPTVRMINELMFSLLGGNLKALNGYFSIAGRQDAKGWQLTLTPKQAALGKVMRKIELSGDQYVRSMRMDESNGDATSIVFSQQNATPKTLSKDEEARFD
ncbi:outer membrane lipoprotein carrier protein LolA [Chromobacterium violaceum]|uniref:outer membrane lipoprotein carrier protein LolA n=1 Tax=Chromobacterium violaceum TaxID=536 RepID=UPI00069F8373|nr:outer membrane lipoprotein carrier protein LolA [Chromobacterium violaceum]MCD0492251.1 outer membrane lipoprotein carrier protein LolA [Chromobacterium violaceum]